jgi:hypothetical protein
MVVQIRGGRLRSTINVPSIPTPPGSARFYSDPAGLLAGNIYIGTSLTSNTDPASKHEGFGNPPGVVAVRRTFDTVSPFTSTISRVDTDISLGRLPIVSVKPQQYTPSGGVVTAYYGFNGTQATAQASELLSLCNTLKTKVFPAGPDVGEPYPIWICLNHEPEDEIPSGGTETQAKSDFAAASQRLKDAITSSGATNLIQVDILMGYTFQNSSGRDWAGWLAACKGTIIGLDYYSKATSSTQWQGLLGTRLDTLATRVETVNKPVAVCEYGHSNWAYDASPTNWQNEIQGFLNYIKARNWVAASYFDSAINSTDFNNRPWELATAQASWFATNPRSAAYSVHAGDVL